MKHHKYNGVYLIFLLSLVSFESFAHGGRLNSSGCHNDRKNGGYHCHRPQGQATAPTSAKPVQRVSTNSESPVNSGSNSDDKTKVFKNCAEARAAGAAPVLASDPRFGKHLDRDGDGIGCE